MGAEGVLSPGLSDFMAHVLPSLVRKKGKQIVEGAPPSSPAVPRGLGGQTC